MRTTVEVPDPVFPEMKVLAAGSGSSVKKFILRAIEREVSMPGAGLEGASP